MQPEGVTCSKKLRNGNVPLQDSGNGDFFKGGASFPSEHSAIAWSICKRLGNMNIRDG